jgi:CPA2 family monovalent cation:H+ antiporter-2
MHSHQALTALAIVVLAALACGMGMTRFKQPAVVGYILAGVILGPSMLGLVRNRESVQFLAELGVLMLLFLVGMELSIKSFKTVWRLATWTTLAQIGGSLGIMLILAPLFGWPLGVAVLFAFVIALSSTAVAIKMLEDSGELKTPAGEITVSILIAQDLAVVPMMIVVGAWSGDGFGIGGAFRVLLAIGFLAGLIYFLSRRDEVRLPFAAVFERSADLRALAGIVFCFGAAAISGLLGLSPAYGAFVAGVLIGNSAAREQMIHAAAPIQSILMMVFFLSIGLLLDLGFIWDNLGVVLVMLVAVTLGKSGFNILTLRLLGQPWPRAAIAGVMLAQIGEFSFLLAAIAIGGGLIGPYGHGLIVSTTVLSLALSPFWLETARRLHRIGLLGVTSQRELLRLLYGDETKAVMRGLAWLGRMAEKAVAPLAGRPRRAAAKADESDA